MYNIFGMKKNIYQLAESLKIELQNDPRIIALNQLEEKMNQDEEVMRLAYQKDLLASEYSDILNHFDRDSEPAIKIQKKLYEAKKALDEHPLVQQYLSAYKEVRELYTQINDILLTDLSPSLCPKGK